MPHTLPSLFMKPGGGRHTAGVAAVVVASTLLIACGHEAIKPPTWPVKVQLRLVNGTSDTVFIRAEGEESLDPGVAHLAPKDSACTTVNAYADPVPVEVHSVTAPAVTYGSASIHPLSSIGWRAVVTTSGVTADRSPGCS